MKQQQKKPRKRKKNVIEKEIRFVVTRIWGGKRGNCMKVVKRSNFQL